MTLYAVVSWARDEKSLLFWNGFSWGSPGHAEFFGTKGGVLEALQLVPPVGKPEYGPPALLDVRAFNEKYNQSIGPAQQKTRGESY